MRIERLRTRIIRLYKMEELLLSTAGLTVVDVSRRLGVNRRTIYRDIEAMQEIGIPIYKDDGLFTILGTYKVPSYRSKIVSGASP